ncbi:hypothetical protein [Neorhizobium tomejilense]|uniref:hypothetical protein n=1 Tax=Neorhizobium tomejilense TaxID=2093828 RepID=UPI003ECD6942
MKNAMLDLRRFFRNRFERLVNHNDADGSGVGDGSAIGLRELCAILAADDEQFPRHYDRHLRWICGAESMTWFRDERSYGDVARLVGRYVEARDQGERRPDSGWVREILYGAGLPEIAEHAVTEVA